MSGIPLFAKLFAALFAATLLLSWWSGRARPVVYNLAFVFLALMLAELYFAAEKPDISRAYLHVAPNKDLGYGGRPGAVRAVKTWRGGTIYDVAYTLDRNGVRVTPGPVEGPAVHFFMDSFTFGEGVNDDQTLPATFAKVTGMRAFNFGFSGYGPHQMLRMLELDLPGKDAAPPPRLVVATILPSHIERTAGRVPWDQDGPRYEVRNGKAEYTGTFRQRGLPAYPAADRLFRELMIYQAWRPAAATPAPPPSRAEDIARERELFLAIVKRSRDIVKERYGVPMVTVLWDLQSPNRFDPDDTAWIEQHVADSGIPVMRLSRRIARSDLAPLFIPRDNHPTVAIYCLVVQELLRFLAEQHIDIGVPSRAGEGAC